MKYSMTTALFMVLFMNGASAYESTANDSSSAVVIHRADLRSNENITLDFVVDQVVRHPGLLIVSGYRGSLFVDGYRIELDQEDKIVEIISPAIQFLSDALLQEEGGQDSVLPRVEDIVVSDPFGGDDADFRSFMDPNPTIGPFGPEPPAQLRKKRWEGVE
ncbi:MAG: hypothetical protein EVA65_13415 [Oceanococcus sp.]|nr:MAG: hypothetical protein EVA65_13415 [Oceanococcus sp.]